METTLLLEVAELARDSVSNQMTYALSPYLAFNTARLRAARRVKE
jgi:predicted GTPase